MAAGLLTADEQLGRGGLGLWRSTQARSSDAFAAPLNMAVLNTTDDEHEVALSADGVELFFVVDGETAASVRLLHRLRNGLD